VSTPLLVMIRRTLRKSVIVTTAVVMGCLVTPVEVVVGQTDSTCASQILAFRNLKTPVEHADSVSVDRLRAIQGMLACQDTADDNAASRRRNGFNAESARLIKMYLEIPEYHDEGRLPAGSDGTGKLLGPVAAIYASPFLQGFTRSGQIIEHGFPGMLAAIVVVERRIGDNLPATYSNLFLRFGVNCIWLHLPPPAAATPYGKDVAKLPLSAYVSYAGDPAECRQGWMGKTLPAGFNFVIQNAVRGPLPVVAVRDDAFRHPTDYPPVARFDTDASGNPVLGFKCLDAFCEVLPRTTTGGPTQAWKAVRAPTGLAPVTGDRPMWSVPAGTQPAAARVRVIKGWHDEQDLGVRDDNYVWRPSGVTATIVPNPGAAMLDSASFHARWHDVATITLHGDPPANSSYQKWGLQKGENTVNLGYNPARKLWLVRVLRPDGTYINWSHVKRTRHFDASVPATARFRWTGIDEGIWVPCGNACCQSDGGGGGFQ